MSWQRAFFSRPKAPNSCVKHDVLVSSLLPWLRDGLSNDSDLLYIDGFAGCGGYADNAPGSPVIALRSILGLGFSTSSTSLSRSKKGNTIDVLFFERDRENFQHLVSAVSAIIQHAGNSHCSEESTTNPVSTPETASWLFEGTTSRNRVRVRAQLGEFEEQFLKKTLLEKSPNLKVLAFLDPYGYRGLKMESVVELLRCFSTVVLYFATHKLREVLVRIKKSGNPVSNKVLNRLGLFLGNPTLNARAFLNAKDRPFSKNWDTLIESCHEKNAILDFYFSRLEEAAERKIDRMVKEMREGKSHVFVMKLIT